MPWLDATLPSFHRGLVEVVRERFGHRIRGVGIDADLVYRAI
jgi:hypothetical protein